ncbi:MAG: hypothetical protein V3S16_00840 [Candidatus Desulfatibia sp.]
MPLEQLLKLRLRRVIELRSYGADLDLLLIAFKFRRLIAETNRQVHALWVKDTGKAFDIARSLRGGDVVQDRPFQNEVKAFVESV